MFPKDFSNSSRTESPPSPASPAAAEAPFPDYLRWRLEEALDSSNLAFTARRDLELETRILDLNKVELKLLSTLGSAKMKSWLRGGRQRRGFYEIGQYRIATRAHSSRSPDLGDRLAEIANNIKLSTDVLKSLAGSKEDGSKEDGGSPEPQRGIDSFASQMTQHCARLQDMAMQVVQPVRYRTGCVYDTMTGLPLVPTNGDTGLVEFYSRLMNLPCDTAVETLREDLAIDYGGGVDLPVIHTRSGWHSVPSFAGRPSTPLPPRMPLRLRGRHCPLWEDIHSYDRYGRMVYAVRAVLLNDGNTVVLPWTVWNRHGEDDHCTLYLPPQKVTPIILGPPIPIVKSPLVIFDAPEVALAVWQCGNPRGERYASWYGGVETADRVEWSLLPEEEVYYVVCKHGEISKDDATECARRACARLHALGIKTIIVDLFADWHNPKGSVPNFRWQWSTSSPELLDLPDSVAELKKSVGDQPDGGKFIQLRNVHDFEDIPYIVEPVIPEASISLMHARAGIGKTWLALHIACSVASGTEIFGKWVPKGEHTVLYIDGEMGAPLMAKRLKQTAAVFGETKCESIDRGLLLKSVGSGLVDLSVEEGQEEIERSLAKARALLRKPPTLLVLDNLGALTQYSDSTKSWRDLYAWLRDLKQRGIATLLVHHSNKAGAQRGTEAKVASVDNSFRISEADGGGPNMIALRIEIEKGRELEGKAKRPLVVEFNPSSRKPGWRVRPGVPAKGGDRDEQLRRTIQEGLSEGWTNAEIADELEMNIHTFKTLKARLGLTRGYSKRAGAGE